MARGAAPWRTDHDRQRRSRASGLVAVALLGHCGQVAGQEPACNASATPSGRACVWTGDCDVPGCGSLCLANLTRVSAFTALEDAAWRPGWYELCPRLSELVSFFGAASTAATPARRRLHQAGGGEVQLPCPTAEAVDAVAPIMQGEATRWRAALAADETGQPLTQGEASLGFILAAPHEFRVLSTYLLDPPTLVAYLAANCTQALIAAERASAYLRYLPEVDRQRVATGAALSACRDNNGAAERHFARLQSLVPACTFPYPESGTAFCFPDRLAFALYTPDNTGCAAGLADAYGLPPSPLTAASQHVDAIQAACSAATSQEACGAVDTAATEASLDASYAAFPYAVPLATDPPPPALPPPVAAEPLPGPAEAASPELVEGPVDTSGRVAGQTQQETFCSSDTQQVEAGVCEWTGDCAVPSCGGRCQGRLLAASAFFALEDAAWSPEWWEVCPRLARIISFQIDRMDGLAPPPPGAGAARRSLLESALSSPARDLLDAGAAGESILRGAACPSPADITRVAPAFQNVTRNWETVLRAVRDGRAVPVDLRNIERTIERHPHEFRVLVRIMSTGARMREYFAASCTDGVVRGGAQRMLGEYVDVELAPDGAVELCRDSGNATEFFYQRQIEAARTCLPPFGQRPSCYSDPATGVAWTPTTAPCAAALAQAYGVQGAPLADAVPLVRQLDRNCQNATSEVTCVAASSNDVLSVLGTTYKSFPYRAPLSDDREPATESAVSSDDYEYEEPIPPPSVRPQSTQAVEDASGARTAWRAVALPSVAAAAAAWVLS